MPTWLKVEREGGGEISLEGQRREGEGGGKKSKEESLKAISKEWVGCAVNHSSFPSFLLLLPSWNRLNSDTRVK